MPEGVGVGVGVGDGVGVAVGEGVGVGVGEGVGVGVGVGEVTLTVKVSLLEKKNPVESQARMVMLYLPAASESSAFSVFDVLVAFFTEFT